MGFGRFLVFRSVNTLVVLFLTLLVTVLILGPSIDTIVVRGVEQEVRGEIVQNRALVSRFNDPRDLQAFIDGQVQVRLSSLGLNDPFFSPVRIGNLMFKIMTLDFGQSFYLRSYEGSSNVKAIILEALPRTILLFSTATIITAFLGISIGAMVAKKAGSLFDRLTSTFAVVSFSFPLWWVGMLMILAFAYTFPIFPARATPLIPPSDPGYILSLLYHMTLPLITIVLISFGGWAYVVRNLMIGTLQEDYITVARAKGVPESKVLYGHALRSAAPPIITIIALSLSGSLGGAIITEAVFDWPGIGRLYFAAISVLDLPVIVGLTYVLTLVFLLSIFIADILYAYFDPRVKVG